jgi:hypothetical protein
MAPTLPGLIPPARDPFRAGKGFSHPLRGFHPANAGLLTVRPYGAIPASSSRVARIAGLCNDALWGLRRNPATAGADSS